MEQTRGPIDGQRGGSGARGAPGERNGRVVELGPAIMAFVIGGLDSISCFNKAIEEGGLRGEFIGVRWWRCIDARE